jgi:transcriptional accessory protein Tex/SPT6
MPADLLAKLSQRLGVGRERVLPVCALLDSGLHPVFIAHYRKSATGGMDEAALRRLMEVRRELTALEDARQRALRVAEVASASTPELRARLDEAEDPESIEDLVRPLRPKRRTAGFVAKERGLGPLADYAWSPPTDGPDLLAKAAEFVNPGKEVRSPDEALAGAGHILAERIADDPKVRGAARRLVLQNGILKAHQAPGSGKQAAEFRPYFQFQEPISHLPPHRILAVTRGERVKALKVTIEVPPEGLRDRLLHVIFPGEPRRAARPVSPPAAPPLAPPPGHAAAAPAPTPEAQAPPPAAPASESQTPPAPATPAEGQTPVAPGPPAETQTPATAIPAAESGSASAESLGRGSPEPPRESPAAPTPPAEGQAAAPPAPGPLRAREFLDAVAADALQRLVLPAVEREVRRQLLDRADAHAIEVFAANLRSLLMTRPVRGKRVLAIQPGFRTGCKVVALDATGTLLGETIIYPLEPQQKTAEGKAALMAEIQRHAVEIIAIGNGTGCREVEQLVSELIQDQALAVEYTIVSEAGASAWADSDLARHEFPNLDAAIRATVSIGRRLQDPLAEFVRIDPRAIGVGLYQHDVNQDRLRRALDETMESCAAAVGADAGAASPLMLRRIPGLDEPQVTALVAKRQAAPLASREDFRSLPGWDDRTFLAAAGFLRIHGDNPLDATRVHPESYPAVERLLASLGHSLADLKAPASAQAVRKKLTGLPLEPLAAELQVPLADLMELVAALQNPQSDPRSQHHGPIFRKKMRELADLQPGMWVKGTVRNVVDFGAFVDIGLKEDGLVHISQFSRRYVRNPLKFLHVGDVVDVRIVSIEADKHRIALTLISETPPPKREPKPRGRRPAEEARRPSAPEGAPAEVGAAPGESPSSSQGPPSGASLRGRASEPRTGSSGRAAGRPQRRPPSPARAKSQSGAPGESRPAADRRPERRPPSGQRRPAPAARDGAGTGRDERPRGARFGRGPPDRRSGSDKPRIIVSKSRGKADSRPPDALGLPKIRWASYDSDPNEEQYEEQMPPQEPKKTPAAAAPSEAAPGPSAPEDSAGAGVAVSPQVSAEPGATTQPARAVEPPQAETPNVEPLAAPPPEEKPPETAI